MGVELMEQLSSAPDITNDVLSAENDAESTQLEVATKPIEFVAPQPVRKYTRRSQKNRDRKALKRSKFRAARREAAAAEAQGVNDESLKNSYVRILESDGRRPSFDDLVGQYVGKKAVQKAVQLVGDFHTFSREIDEEIAWSMHERDMQVPQLDESIELDALPSPDLELPTLYEKKPADWSRGDVIAVYSAFSKHFGHWLNGAELRELCKDNTIPASYKTLISMFSGVQSLTEEARRTAEYYVAKQQRDAVADEQVLETKNNEISPVTNAEIPIETSDPRGKYYEVLVDGKDIPKPPTSIGSKVPVTFVDDRSININGRVIALEGHELYAFNALLLSRDEATSPQDLAELGFDPNAKISDLTGAIRKLGTKLKRASENVELIGKWTNGKKSLFILSPSLKIADGRRLRKAIIEAQSTPDVQSQSTEVVPRIERQEFASNQVRIDAMTAIVTQYREDPSVLGSIEALKTASITPRHKASELDHYFDYMKQFAVLDADEELSLFEFIEEGLTAFKGADMNAVTPAQHKAFIRLTTAHQLLFLSNMRLVVSIAKPYARHNMVPYIDLIHEGNIGLNKAICTFDLETGNKFSTYGTWWIRAQVSKAMADQGRTIRVPVHAHNDWLELNGKIRELTNILAREPTEKEIVKYSGIDIKKVQLLRERGGRNPYSIDALYSASSGVGNLSLADILPDPDANPDIIANQLSAREEIRQLFASRGLSDREKLTLGLRFATYDSIPRDLEVKRPGSNRKISYLGRVARINSLKGMTLEQVGRILGVTRERTRQIERDALEKARIVVENNRGTTYLD